VPASGSGTARGGVLPEDQSEDDESDDGEGGNQDSGGGGAGGDAESWEKSGGNERVKWRAWSFTDLQNLRSFGSLDGPSAAKPEVAAKFAEAIPLNSLNPPDKQNVADAKGVFTEKLEGLLRQHVEGSGPLGDFIGMVRAFYDTFSQATTPDGTDHDAFMVQKRDQLQEIQSYFDVWGRCCASAFGKKKGGAPKGCISACTLDSIAVTCENVPVLMAQCKAKGIELHMHALSTNTVESFFSCVRECVKKPTVSDVLRDFHKIGDEMEKKLRGGGEKWVYKFNRKCPYETYILQKRTISAAVASPAAKRKRASAGAASPAGITAEERKKRQQQLADMRCWVKEIGGGAGNGKTSRDYNKKQGKCFDPDTVWWTLGEGGADISYWAVQANYPAMQAVLVVPLAESGGRFRAVESADQTWQFHSSLHATMGARRHTDGSFSGVKRRVGSVAAAAESNVTGGDVTMATDADSDSDDEATGQNSGEEAQGDEYYQVDSPQDDEH
jgi:hypothetical protein